MAVMVVILDIGTDNFSNSEPPCWPNASYQVLVHSDIIPGVDVV